MKDPTFPVPSPENGPRNEKTDESGTHRLPDDYWFRVMSSIAERFSEDVSPISVRAHALVRAFGIPSGQFSTLESHPDGSRDTDAERLYAGHVAAPAGVRSPEKGIPSSAAIDLSLADCRDLLKSMDSRSVAIIEADLAEAKAKPDGYAPMLYFRMPGGVDLFLKGYVHRDEEQEKHGRLLREITGRAQVIAVEGYAEYKTGKSLTNYLRFFKRGISTDGYGELMVDAMEAGFKGIFAEVDPRDWSHVDLERAFSESSLPDSFFETYFEYLKRESPEVATGIGGWRRLRELLDRQTHRHLASVNEELRDGTVRYGNRFVEAGRDGDFRTSLSPTGFEFGSQLFSDALSAIRLHIIARIMADGKIPKGPILDIQGDLHLSGKQFFMRYPEYAMEIVLRTLLELLSADASDVFGREKKKIEKIRTGLDKPDWERIARKIGTIPFMNSQFLIEPHVHTFDFFREYGLRPGDSMPSEAEIADIVTKVDQK